MKTWLWIFAAGLMAGLALGLVLAPLTREGPGRGGEPGADRGEGLLSRAITGSRGLLAARAGKGGERRSGWRRARRYTGLRDYFQSLATLDEEYQVNAIEFLRQAHQITMFSEQEARIAMEALAEAGQAGDDHDEHYSIAAALILARWAEMNGPEALCYAIENENGSRWEHDFADIAPFIVTSWAEADPAGAAAWFWTQAGEDGDERYAEMLDDHEVQSALFSALVRTDREKARDLATDFGGTIHRGAMAIVAKHEGSEEGLRQLLAQTGTDDVTAREELLAEWTRRDPAAASAWLEGNPSPQTQSPQVFAVAYEYLKADPEAGTEWFMRQEVPDTDIPRRLRLVTESLARHDIAAAAEWLAQQPDGPQRDAAESRLTHFLVGGRNWTEALSWAADIRDEKMRMRAANAVFYRAAYQWDEPTAAAIFEAGRAAGFEEDVVRWKQKRDLR